MAKTSIKNISIRGISSTVPKQKIINSEIINFSAEEIRKNSKLTGVISRRKAPKEVCTSDLCINAAEDLFKNISWKKEDIDLLIFVSQTPDYILPATSAVIQNKLGLNTTCISLDINQGCSGYVYGLWTASQLLQGEQISKALLLVGDTCSKFVSTEDRSTSLLFGDAGTATAIEFNKDFSNIFDFNLGTDGSGYNNLIIPAGGFRNKHPVLDETQSDSIIDKEDLYMNGGEIFNFTIKSVPGLVKTTLGINSYDIDDIDYFIFHQANKFMLKHLIKKSKIPSEKAPFSIEEFGNTSSASIPLTICTRLKDELQNKNKLISLFGFGVGFSWAGSVVSTEGLNYIGMNEL